MLDETLITILRGTPDPNRYIITGDDIETRASGPI